ncbi:hypothetical protein Dvar_74600 [Desulfosarcina variabilis str. Montpellier]|uniref:hypothetical protein n=1 Tax=Desulfosarcina variabilis TaxID=2300 RepID=UPI003AFADE99
MEISNMDAYNDTFNRKVHFWGRLSIAIAFFMSFSIPFYLTFIAGHHVDLTVFVKGIIFVLGFVGIIYFIEPVSYFPVLGPIGTYMSFLSGNIGNMRMPVVGAVQNALDAEAGSKKAEMAAVFGLAASNVVNLAILFVVIIGGTALVSALPANILGAFAYAVPGIIGAMIVTFGIKMSIKHIIYTVILGLVVIQLIKFIGKFAPALGKLLSIGQIGVAAAFAIAFAVYLANKAKE